MTEPENQEEREEQTVEVYDSFDDWAGGVKTEVLVSDIHSPERQDDLV